MVDGKMVSGSLALDGEVAVGLECFMDQRLNEEMDGGVGCGGALVVVTTFPDRETGRGIVRELLEARLIACGTLLPTSFSIYRWKGSVQEDEEVPGLLKTTEGSYGEMVEKLCECHPYDVPEVIALKPEAVSLPYLRWLCEEVAGG